MSRQKLYKKTSAAVIIFCTTTLKKYQDARKEKIDR